MRFHPAPPPSVWRPKTLALVLLVFGLGWLARGLTGGPGAVEGALAAFALAGALALASLLEGRGKTAAPRGRCRRCDAPLTAAPAPERCPACDEAAPLYDGSAPTERLPRPGRASRGFTLIEVLMTVAITALVFAMIGGILLSVIKASENIENKSRTEKAGYGILTSLRRDLSGVYAYALGGPAFEGKDGTELGRDADSLSFVTTADVLPLENGVRPRFIEVGYKVGGGDSSQEGLLTLFRRCVAYDGTPLEGGEYAELYGRVHAFDVKYLDGESRDWRDSWDEPERLPLAVKVHLELALDEAERMAAEQGLDIPKPVFEMIVGIPTAAAPAPDAGGDAAGDPGQ